MKYPKVSVIIPLYNQKLYVSEAINSIISQTYENIEIIVVNDGSTDCPEKVLEQFKGKITVINQKNSGLSGARNAGILKSKGEYIQFLDADDLLFPEKISRQINEIIDNKGVIPYCEIEVLNDNDGIISTRTTDDYKDIYSNYYLFWEPYPTPIHSLLFDRDIFNEFGFFDEDLKANEDRCFLAKLAYFGIKFKFTKFKGGLYRKHQFSMNTDPSLMVDSAIKFYKKMDKITGDEFVKRKFGYSGFQMMCANLTFFYFLKIREGEKRRFLKKIRFILKKEGIYFFADPLKSRFKNNKFTMMLISCYFKRYLNILKKVLFAK